MPINQYFQNGTRQEQTLYESLLIEAIKIYGTDVFYIPRKIVKQDLILNEDLISQFDAAYKVEMYVETVDGFEGDGDLLSKFGVEIRDQITLVVANLRWNQLVGRFGYEPGRTRPREGDLIYMPLTKALFEIKFVENEKPFYQLKNLPTFKLICELFEYESQNIDTNIVEIDTIQNTHSRATEYGIGSSSGVFESSEKVSFVLANGTTTGTAEFFNYGDATGSSIVIGPITLDSGEPADIDVGTVFTGLTSGATATISSVPSLTDPVSETFHNDPGFAQNNNFTQSMALIDFIDFSESNPFGEPIN